MEKKTFYFDSRTYNDIPEQIKEKIKNVMQLEGSSLAEFQVYMACKDQHSFVLELWRVTERKGLRVTETTYFGSVGYDCREDIPYEIFELGVQTGDDPGDTHLYVFGKFKTFTGALKSLVNHGNYTINERVPLMIY